MHSVRRSMSLLRNKQLRADEFGEIVANCTLYALRPWYEGDLVVLLNKHEDKAVFRDVFERLGRSPSPEKYVRNWCWPLRPARVRALKTMPSVSWRRLALLSFTWYYGGGNRDRVAGRPTLEERYLSKKEGRRPKNLTMRFRGRLGPRAGNPNK